jgi:hypothetical protein
MGNLIVRQHLMFRNVILATFSVYCLLSASISTTNAQIASQNLSKQLKQHYMGLEVEQIPLIGIKSLYVDIDLEDAPFAGINYYNSLLNQVKTDLKKNGLNIDNQLTERIGENFLILTISTINLKEIENTSIFMINIYVKRIESLRTILSDTYSGRSEYSSIIRDNELDKVSSYYGLHENGLYGYCKTSDLPEIVKSRAARLVNHFTNEWKQVNKFNR